jgi:hypothetical protein
MASSLAKSRHDRSSGVQRLRTVDILLRGSLRVKGGNGHEHDAKPEKEPLGFRTGLNPLKENA